jgi:hypothetical protein
MSLFPLVLGVGAVAVLAHVFGPRSYEVDLKGGTVARVMGARLVGKFDVRDIQDAAGAALVEGSDVSDAVRDKFESYWVGNVVGTGARGTVEGEPWFSVLDGDGRAWVFKGNARMETAL